MSGQHAKVRKKKKKLFLTFFETRAVDLLKDKVDQKPLLAEVWATLAQCQEAVQDAKACAKSCQVSVLKTICFWFFVEFASCL